MLENLAGKKLSKLGRETLQLVRVHSFLLLSFCPGMQWSEEWVTVGKFCKLDCTGPQMILAHKRSQDRKCSDEIKWYRKNMNGVDSMKSRWIYEEDTRSSLFFSQHSLEFTATTTTATNLYFPSYTEWYNYIPWIVKGGWIYIEDLQGQKDRQPVLCLCINTNLYGCELRRAFREKHGYQ